MDIHQISNMALLQYASADDRYVPLEYLESDGGQYIDTGVSVNWNYGFDLDWCAIAPFVNQEIFGGGQSYRNGLGLCTHSAGGAAIGFTCGAQEIVASPYAAVPYSRTVYSIHDHKAYIDGVDITTVLNPTANAATTRTLWMFRNSASNKATTAQRIWGCKIYDDTGALIRDFVPMLRLRDSKPGMYDRVGKKFYTNKGTGEFTYKVKYYALADEDLIYYQAFESAADPELSPAETTIDWREYTLNADIIDNIPCVKNTNTANTSICIVDMPLSERTGTRGLTYSILTNVSNMPTGSGTTEGQIITGGNCIYNNSIAGTVYPVLYTKRLSFWANNTGLWTVAAAASATIPAKTWVAHSFVINPSRKTVAWYLDGSLFCVSANNNTVPGTSLRLNIGFRLPLLTAVARVNCYERALTTSEIYYLHRSMKLPVQ